MDISEELYELIKKIDDGTYERARALVEVLEGKMEFRDCILAVMEAQRRARAEVLEFIQVSSQKRVEEQGPKPNAQRNPHVPVSASELVQPSAVGGMGMKPNAGNPDLDRVRPRV